MKVLFVAQTFDTESCEPEDGTVLFEAGKCLQSESGSEMRSCGRADRSSSGGGETLCSSDSDGLQEWLIEEASAIPDTLRMTVLLQEQKSASFVSS